MLKKIGAIGGVIFSLLIMVLLSQTNRFSSQPIILTPASVPNASTEICHPNFMGGWHPIETQREKVTDPNIRDEVIQVALTRWENCESEHGEFFCDVVQNTYDESTIYQLPIPDSETDTIFELDVPCFFPNSKCHKGRVDLAQRTSKGWLLLPDPRPDPYVYLWDDLIGFVRECNGWTLYIKGLNSDWYNPGMFPHQFYILRSRDYGRSWLKNTLPPFFSPIPLSPPTHTELVSRSTYNIHQRTLTRFAWMEDTQTLYGLTYFMPKKTSNIDVVHSTFRAYSKPSRSMDLDMPAEVTSILSETILSVYKPLTYTRDIVIEDNRLYVLGEGQLSILNLENSSSLTLTNKITLVNRISNMIGNSVLMHNLTMSDDLLYITSYYPVHGYIIEASDPYTLHALGRLDTTVTQNIALDDDHLYAANYNQGLTVIDVSNPTTPTLIASYDQFGYAVDVVVNEETAYVIDGFSKLHILDVSSPLTPVLLGHYETPLAPNRLAITGQTVYVVALNELQVLDVSQPSDPKLLGSLSFVGYTQDIAVQHERLYLANGQHGLFAVDVSQPSEPTLVGHYQADVTSIAFKDNWVYMVVTHPENTGYGGLQSIQALEVD